MGKPALAHTTSDTDALSLYTTPDDYDYGALPSYTDSEIAASSSTADRPLEDPPTYVSHTSAQEEYSAVPVAQPPWLVQVGGKTVSTSETTVRIDQRLTDPYNLYAYVMDYVRMVPPKPGIRIVGHHFETSRGPGNEKKSKERVVDFDVYVSLQSMLRHALTPMWWADNVVQNGDKAYRGGFRKTRADEHTQGVQLSDEPIPDLKEWCEQYCASTANLKVFRITREVNGLDTKYLESLLGGMIRSTDYRGQVEITFPVQDRYVDIYSPHIVNQWRTNWFRWIFYFSMLWIITWPILFFMTKWYAVYNVVWNFSVTAGTDRTFACLSEKQWFDHNQGYLKHLVLNRFRGEADISPPIVAEFNNRPAAPARATSGNAQVDTAIHAVQQGVGIWNQVRGGSSLPTPGAWGYDQ